MNYIIPRQIKSCYGENIMIGVYEICPNCHSMIKFDVEKTIYSNSKGAILDYSMFVRRCHACQHRILGNYSCYYSDPKQKYIIKVDAPEQNEIIENLVTYKNFRSYQVDNMAELALLIQLIDEGEKEYISSPWDNFLRPGRFWDGFVFISNKNITRADMTHTWLETLKQEKKEKEEKAEINEESSSRETWTALLGLTGMAIAVIILLPVAIVLLLGVGWLFFVGVFLGSCLLALPFMGLYK